ncbi:MAG: bifunctional glutamate N-acetyltransferase/amino-acid acetyltransferase ArgJ [Myxococcota bacterium]
MGDVQSDAQLPEVAGFRFAGIAAGIKNGGELDLGLVAADGPVATAAVFTENQVRAAPVELSAARLERGRAQAVLVNSGNANACTGKAGDRAARETTGAVADALGIDPAMVLPASTGVIGEPLPAERIVQAVPRLVAALSPGGAADFARAILTTDRGSKTAHRRVAVARNRQATVLGIAKGAGMIHPRMATTLAFVVTDAPMHSSFLRRALRQATDRSFNRVTVDRETSTNDTIVAMASGRVQAEALRGSGPEARKFMDALAGVLEELAKQVVADGEGAAHLVRVEVVGAPSEEAACKVAERVATSLLVKTALHGCDPNWGRIIAAAGMAGVAFDPSKVEIRFDDVIVARKGLAVGQVAEAAARQVMQRPEYTLRLRIGPGRARGHHYTCDLGHEYVRINADYRT